MLRCAKIIAPANVSYISSDVSTERAQVAKKLENPGVSASKIEPGSLEIELGRPSAGAKSRENTRSDTEFSKVTPNEPVRARKERMLERFDPLMGISDRM